MKKVLLVASACLLMTSCVIDKREMVSAVDQYNKEFVKVFGETDPNHTWSMVENKKVEVNLTKPSNVKVANTKTFLILLFFIYFIRLCYRDPSLWMTDWFSLFIDYIMDSHLHTTAQFRRKPQYTFILHVDNRID